MTRTETTTYEKARALFLATLMVVSVFGGTVAFAGSAAAGLSDNEISDTVVQPGETITVSGTDDAANDGTVRLFLDEDGSSDYSDGDESWTISGTKTEDEVDFSQDIVLPNKDDLTQGTGTYDLRAIETRSLDAGDAGTTIGSLTFDDQSPSADGENADPAGGETIANDEPILMVPLSDEGDAGLDESSIEVTITQDGEEITYLVNNGEPDDGVNYDSGALTVDISKNNIPALPEGPITVAVDAKDEAGNEMSTFTYDFEVDTSGPNFELVKPTAGGEVDSQQDIVVSTEDIDSETVTLTVTGPDGEIYTLADDDSVTFDSGTITAAVGPDEGVENLPDGQITVDVEAGDGNGNTVSEQFTFGVDDTLIDATAVSYVDDEDGIYNTEDWNDDDTESILATFDDSVDAETVVAELDLNGDGEVDKKLENFESAGEQQARAELDISSEYDTDSAQVTIIQAEDNVGNGLTEDPEDATTTFDIDTIAPGVSDDGLPAELSGYVDLTDDFTVTGEDVDSVTYEYAAWDSDDYETIDDPDYVDTKEVFEGDGDYKLNVIVEDDDGNVYSLVNDATATPLTIDNVEDAVSYDGSSSIETVEGEINLLDDFTTTASQQAVDFSYKTYSEKTGAFGSAKDIDGHEVDTTTLEGSVVKITAEVTGPNGEVKDSASFITEIDNQPGRYDVEELDSSSGVYLSNAHGDKTVTVIVKSKVDLTTLDVTVSNNHYHKDSETTLSLDKDDFTEKTENRYVSDVTVDYDGEYTAEVTDVATDDSTDLSVGDDDKAIVDTEDPSIVDADVVGGDDKMTEVRVRFNEPVKGVAVSDLGFTAKAEVIDAHGLPADNGQITVVLNDEAQTGDDEKLTATELTEKFGEESSTDSTKKDVTFALDLSEGLNVVSVPAETGEVDLSEIDSDLDDAGVESVWTYDNGEWKKYITGEDHGNLEALEGGQGYIVDASAETELDVEVENVPEAGLENEMNSQNLEPGWNLVGHYQEGSQPADLAFSWLADNTWTVQKGYTGVEATELDSGQGYWLAVDKPDTHMPVPYTGLPSERPDVYSVTVTDTTGEDGTIDPNDEVEVTAKIDDDNPMQSVTADIGDLNKRNVELTHESGNTYTGTFTADEPVSIDGDSVFVFVTATDTNNNLGSATAEANVDTELDLKSVSAADNGDTVTATVEANEELKPGEISAADLSDGSSFGAFTQTDVSSGVYTYEADATGVSDGSYTVDVTNVADLFGNADDPDEDEATDVTVNDVQPSAKWDSANFEVSGQSYDLTQDATVSGEDSTTYAYSIDGGNTWTEISDEKNWDTSEFEDGDVDVRVTASDDQGSSDSIDTATATVNNVQPSAKWDSANFEVSGQSYDLTQDATVSGEDSTTYEYGDVEADSWTEISDAENWDTSELNDGDVDVRVTASDNQDSEDATATASATVNNVEGGSATVDESAGNDEEVDITGSASEDVSVWYVVVGSGDDQPSDTQIENGLNADGDAAVADGSSSGETQSYTDTASGLDSSTSYDVYVLLEDTDGNIQIVTAGTDVVPTGGSN